MKEEELEKVALLYIQEVSKRKFLSFSSLALIGEGFIAGAKYIQNLEDDKRKTED